MNNKEKLLAVLLLFYSYNAFSEQFLVGYQFGTYHYFDTSSCNAPKLISRAVTDVALSYLDNPDSVSTLYYDAINRLRWHCNINRNTPIKLDIEYTVNNKKVALLSVRDTARNKQGKNLWWGERISINKYSQSPISSRTSELTKKFFNLFSQSSAISKLAEKFFNLGTRIILEPDKNKKLKYHSEFLSIDLEELAALNLHTVALEIARIKAPSRKKDNSNRLGLFYIDGMMRMCPINTELMMKAADLGNPVAAYLLTLCRRYKVYTINITRGADAVEVTGKSYPEFMFYLTKAVVGGFSPAFEYKDAMRGYEEEFEKYIKVIRDNGSSYTYKAFQEKEILSSQLGPKNKIPDYEETGYGLNDQILLGNCSRLGLLSASKTKEMITPLLASSIKPRKGWCAAEMTGSRLNIRFGRVKGLNCDETSNGDFFCKVDYRLQCRIDSYKSTAKGNKLICDLFGRAVHSGEMLARRLEDGSLIVIKFRSLGRKKWLVPGV